LSYFSCSLKFHKIESYLIFEMHKKNIWANFQRIIELFTPKIVIMLSNIWVWDPGSGKTYSGSRGQKGTGSATLHKHLLRPISILPCVSDAREGLASNVHPEALRPHSQHKVIELKMT